MELRCVPLQLAPKLCDIFLIIFQVSVCRQNNYISLCGLRSFNICAPILTINKLLLQKRSWWAGVQPDCLTEGWSLQSCLYPYTQILDLRRLRAFEEEALMFHLDHKHKQGEGKVIHFVSNNKSILFIVSLF